jgi:hypothetical protein
MDVFGVPIQIWHALVVEEHSGIVVFIVLALALRVLTDLVARGTTPSLRVQAIRHGSDIIGYAGSLAAVVFLVLSSITGYFIQPYSALVASPLLINKALVALGALFFWCVFFLVRYWFGPGLWQEKRLYAVEVVAAFLGFVFTALAGSIGAELSLGQSVLDPFYKELGFSWRTFVVQPVEIEVTVAFLVIGILVALFFPSRKAKPA